MTDPSKIDDTDMAPAESDAAAAAGIPVTVASTPEGITDDWDDEDDPFTDPNYDLFVLKWTCDDCETVTDVIETLKALAEDFEKRKADGWELETPVENGHMHFRRAMTPGA